MIRIATIILIAGIVLLGVGFHFAEITLQIAGWFMLTTGFIQLIRCYWHLQKLYERHYDISIYSLK